MAIGVDLRWQIVGAHRCGVEKSVIASSLNISKSTVREVLARYRERGTVARKQGSGRPRKTNPRDDGLLVRLVKAHPFSPAPLIKWRWGLPLSSSTIRRRLKENHLKQYRPAVTPLLRVRHVEGRLKWAMTRCLWRACKFRSIVWTDESRFRLFNNDGRVRVWRMKGERFRPDLMLHSSQAQGGSVDIWGAFWFGGRSSLSILTQNVTGLR